MSFFASLFGLPRPLLITDVTRMQGNKLCVAGVSGKETVRLHEPQPNDQLLDMVGGLQPGNLVNVKWQLATRYRRPHREDSRWVVSTLQKQGLLSAPALYARLEPLSFRSVREAYGSPQYYSRRGNPAFWPDKGKRSLAGVNCRAVRIYAEGEGLRANFTDTEEDWRAFPVEDIGLRAHFGRCKECSRQGELRADEALVRVGLGRPFQPRTGEESGCFAQVNLVLPPANAEHFLQGAHP
ncbi:MAG: hypothetical protein Q7T33_12295 [Dehalococcoidia bacterium]|nr:hypothetical protein [Dehalococcoidia bacterium]